MISHRIYSIFFRTLEKSNGILQKKDEAERLLEILFNKTEHNSYFRKQPFGKKTKFLKMENATIPLVILTWLQQLQEHFYLQPTLNKSNDWSDHGRYCNATQKLAVKKRQQHLHGKSSWWTTA